MVEGRLEMEIAQFLCTQQGEQVMVMSCPYLSSDNVCTAGLNSQDLSQVSPKSQSLRKVQLRCTVQL